MLSLVLILLNGVIADDFLVDQDSVKGGQIKPVVAVTSSGYFAVAWEDSISSVVIHTRSDVYVRFFDQDGNPVSSVIRLNTDTLATDPKVSVDDAGRFVCVWREHNIPLGNDIVLYGQMFSSSGESLGGKIRIAEELGGYLHDVSSHPVGGFFVTWPWGNLWGQRYDSTGSEIGERLCIHAPSSGKLLCKDVNLSINGIGKVAVAWDSSSATRQKDIRFQIVDSLNNLVLDSTHQVTDWGGNWLHRKPRVRWLDDDRFVIFWLKTANADWDMINGVQARMFDSEGDSISEIETLVDDPHALTYTSVQPLSVSSVKNDLFAIAYNRAFATPEYQNYGVVGFLADTNLQQVTGIFRLSPSEPHFYQKEWGANVDANSDRIVWVWQDNSRMREHGDTINIDPYFSDIHCKITDWDLVGIEEQPVLSQSPIRLTTSLNRLTYDLPADATFSLYSSDGRKVHTESISGKGTWNASAANLAQGVYFARVEGKSGNANAKLIVIR